MPDSLLHTLGKNKPPQHCGRKAAQLQRLIAHDIPVPVTHVLLWDVHELYLKEKTDALIEVRREIMQNLDLTKAYAVRSSANVEDGQKFSFAGQFDSVLNVQGLENILDAVQTVWESARNPRLKTYLVGSEIPFDQLRMAVIVQEMVDPIVSGVAFSKNPITGLDEIVVEAVAGSGEALVQGGVTPERWVYKWGTWITQPSQNGIDEAVINQVVTQTRTIAATFDFPLDLEWVFSGTAVYWLQLREITALKGLNIYSNRIAREMLPGIIKPLVWSVNVPLVNGAWVDILTELIGPNDIKPGDLSKAFYHRAYFNMGVLGRVFAELGLPKETLELMMGLEGGDEAPRFRPSSKVLKHMPRMLKFALAKLRYGRKIDAFLPQMDRTYIAFDTQPIAEMNEHELLVTLDELIAFNKQAAYMNIVGPLLMLLYNSMFKRSLSRAGLAYEDFDITFNLPEIEQYDPGVALNRLRSVFRQLDPALQEQIKNGSYTDLQAAIGVPECFRKEMARFIERFGHLSDSGNDFSRIPWREEPDFVLRMVVSWDDDPREDTIVQRGGGGNASDKRLLNWETVPLSKSNRWRMGWQYRRARCFRLYRDAISFRYTYGYGLIRNYVLALADRFVERGILAGRDDIFLLYMNEVRALVKGEVGEAVDHLVKTRKQEISQAENIALPEIIYGDALPPPEAQNENRNRLSGIPTSGGYYQGQACIITNLSEFDKMQAGAVLVIPYSDVSWTPLFAKAGAVVAESGGILSHSSIVAREYMVPAVVSVPAAGQVLKDGMMVTVDGYRGEVFLDAS
ncbi:MAG: PEP/pyruvate-binding domain-containing protein [Candidatus Promineifilaceae bacterium]